MNTPLDDISFLARSASRVQLLELLAAGPHDRASLHEATGIPRPTVGRIVTELEARELVTQNGRHYQVSPLGDLLVTEFLSLIETAETVEKLRPVARWFTPEDFDFELERLADARITLPKPSDSIAPLRRSIELLTNANQVNILTFGYTPQAFGANAQATIRGSQTLNAVFTSDVVDEITAEPETAALLHELLSCERATIHCYEKSVPYIIVIIDGMAGIGLTDEQGAPQVLIESTNETVRAWVESTIDDYRREAQLLKPDDLP